MVYEWDENKRLQNFEKHGYDLADGQLVYESPGKITVASHRPHEQRWLDIAEVGGETGNSYTHLHATWRCSSLYLTTEGQPQGKETLLWAKLSE